MPTYNETGSGGRVADGAAIATVITYTSGSNRGTIAENDGDGARCYNCRYKGA